MKNVNIDNILYNLTNTRTYIMSKPLKNGLLLLANNNISFLITKEEFIRLNPKEVGSEIPITFKKLHFKDEQIQSTYIRYPVVNKIAINYKKFLDNLFKIYTSNSSIALEPLHLIYNLNKTKDEYIIRVMGIKGSLSFEDLFNYIVDFSPNIWEKFKYKKNSNFKNKKERLEYKNVSVQILKNSLKDASLFSEITYEYNPKIKAELLNNYIQSVLFSLENKLKVLVKSFYLKFEVEIENETFKSLRSNRKVIRRSPKFNMPVEFNTINLYKQLEEQENYNETYREAILLSQYEDLIKGLKVIKNKKKPVDNQIKTKFSTNKETDLLKKKTKNMEIKNSVKSYKKGK